MTYDDILPFLDTHHNAVATTYRKDGIAQMSVVSCGPYDGGVAFTTTGGRAKLANLLRDPRCTILISTADWREYVVVDGTADVLWSGRTGPEKLRLALRGVYTAVAGRDHPDWDDYDRVMVEDRRAAIIVRAQRIYGNKR